MDELIVFLNKVFRRPRVGGRDSDDAYSEWEYRWGRSLVEEYLEPAGDLKRKRILDIGCGLGGKTMAYGEAGAAEVFGADLAVGHAAASTEYAGRKKREFGWGFSVADAAALPFPDRSFDTVIANDAMEHFAEPEPAVREMSRVTKKGGAIWLFFTPHYSPLGSHLYDYVYTPWCHLMFRRQSLKGAIRKVLRTREPECETAEIERKLGQIMTSYDNDLNHMSIGWFKRIIGNHPELKVVYEEFKPAKFTALKPLTRIPYVRELVTGTVICQLERVTD